VKRSNQNKYKGPKYSSEFTQEAAKLLKKAIRTSKQPIIQVYHSGLGGNELGPNQDPPTHPHQKKGC
jgi:hypothetical protein